MKTLFIAVLSLGTVGCASIVNDANQPIRLDAVTADGKPVTGADCKLKNDFGAYAGKSGAIVQVHRSSKDLDITCTSQSRSDANGQAISRANAGLAGNILIGGGIGALIDHNKGTAYTYPTWIQLVFGEMRVFDRKYEKEGTVVTGLSPSAVAAATSGQPASAPAASAFQRSDLAVGSGQPASIASGFARIDDVDAVPYLSDRGRNAYREWLAKPTPKAFAIAANGWFGAPVGVRPQDTSMPTDPVERALMICERGARQPCRMYAVNGSVVWVKPESKTAAPSATSPAALPATESPIATAK
jgi:hypothetical protein